MYNAKTSKNLLNKYQVHTPKAFKYSITAYILLTN